MEHSQTFGMDYGMTFLFNLWWTNMEAKVVGDTVFFIKELILPLNSSSQLSIEWGY